MVCRCAYVGLTKDSCWIKFKSARILFIVTSCLFLTVNEVTSSHKSDFKRVCYFTNWSCDLLVKEAHFCLPHIDASLCSHIIYSFVDIDVASLSLTPSRVDDETKDGVVGRYVLFNNLKKSHPRLKTLLSVGGSYQSEDLKAVTSSSMSRMEFASNSVAYVRLWGFDGLDVDWEYPQESSSLTLLLEALRQADFAQRNSSTNPALILSVAGPASEDLLDRGFQVKEISWRVDFINLMAYDLQGPWSPLTGFNSPLYPRKNDSRFTPEHCVEWVVDMWVRKGAPISKIVLGIAGYGQSYTLVGADHNSCNGPNTTKTITSASTTETSTILYPGPGSPALGPGKPGRLRHLKGQLSYPEICEYTNNGGHVSWDQEQRVPYMSCGNLWVGYDDVKSIKEKVTWAYNQGLGGAMFWSLDLDDFKGDYCHQGRYPLLNAMSNAVMSLTSRNASAVGDNVNHLIDQTTLSGDKEGRLVKGEENEDKKEKMNRGRASTVIDIIDNSLGLLNRIQNGDSKTNTSMFHRGKISGYKTSRIQANRTAMTYDMTGDVAYRNITQVSGNTTHIRHNKAGRGSTISRKRRIRNFRKKGRRGRGRLAKGKGKRNRNRNPSGVSVIKRFRNRGRNRIARNRRKKKPSPRHRNVTDPQNEIHDRGKHTVNVTLAGSTSGGMQSTNHNGDNNFTSVTPTKNALYTTKLVRKPIVDSKTTFKMAEVIYNTDSSNYDFELSTYSYTPNRDTVTAYTKTGLTTQTDTDTSTPSTSDMIKMLPEHDLENNIEKDPNNPFEYYYVAFSLPKGPGGRSATVSSSSAAYLEMSTTGSNNLRTKKEKLNGIPRSNGSPSAPKMYSFQIILVMFFMLLMI